MTSLIALLSVAALVACGGSKPAADPTTPAAAIAPAPTTPAPAPNARTEAEEAEHKAGQEALGCWKDCIDEAEGDMDITDVECRKECGLE